MIVLATAQKDIIKLIYIFMIIISIVNLLSACNSTQIIGEIHDIHDYDVNNNEIVNVIKDELKIDKEMNIRIEKASRIEYDLGKNVTYTVTYAKLLLPENDFSEFIDSLGSYLVYGKDRIDANKLDVSDEIKWWNINNIDYIIELDFLYDSNKSIYYIFGKTINGNIEVYATNK